MRVAIDKANDYHTFTTITLYYTFIILLYDLRLSVYLFTVFYYILIIL